MLQLDRCRSIENIDHHRDAAVGFVNRIDLAFEVLEVSVLDSHSVALP